MKIKVSTWINLARFGNNKLIRSSSLWIFVVPVLAKLLEKLPETLIVSLGENSAQFSLSLPFSWKMLYFSALCFSVASLLFTWKCPYLIKQYKDIRDFNQAGYSGKELLHVFWSWMKSGGKSYIDGSLVSGEKMVNALANGAAGTDLKSSIDSENYLNVLRGLKIKPNEVSASFWHMSAVMASDTPYIRTVIFILYVSGFLMLGSIVILNLMYVLGHSF